jgi:hypothetical protein
VAQLPVEPELGRGRDAFELRLVASMNRAGDEPNFVISSISLPSTRRSKTRTEIPSPPTSTATGTPPTRSMTA